MRQCRIECSEVPKPEQQECIENCLNPPQATAANIFTCGTCKNTPFPNPPLAAAAAAAIEETTSVAPPSTTAATKESSVDIVPTIIHGQQANAVRILIIIHLRIFY